MKKNELANELALFLGLLPVSYFILLITEAGARRVYGAVIQEDVGDRLVQSFLMSIGVWLLLWYFRRGKDVDRSNAIFR